MSVNIYARQAPIHDACGRADYISNSRRQENLMATASTFSRPDYWQILSADAQTAYRQAGGKRENGDRETRACEAREIHLQLPNSALDHMTADQLAKKIANDFKSKYGVECMVAIHYNKTKTNLHCHILFGERQLLQEPEIRIAERNVFIGADGIRKRTKKEILDADGNLLPGCSIVKKGEVLSARYFGDKNLMFEDKTWMDEYRRDMANWINENLQPDKLRTVYDRKGPYLAQKHIGKGTPEPKEKALLEWNKLVKLFNRWVKSGQIGKEEALDYKTRIMLSPDQTTELKAVLAEISRERNPDSENRQSWDRLAARSAMAPLSADVKNRQEKEELRRLYKAQGAAVIQGIDAETDREANRKMAEVAALGDRIQKKKRQLGITADQQRLHDLGRLAGVKPAEVDRLYHEVPKMTGKQWKEVWAGCKAEQSRAWDTYRARQDSIKKDLSRAYKVRKRVRNAEWLIAPGNRRKTLLGIVYAGIVLAHNDSLWKLDNEIDRLKREQTALRREAQRFRAATDKTYETLHTKGLDPSEYVGCVKRMQDIADRIQIRYIPTWEELDPEEQEQVKTQVKPKAKQQRDDLQELMAAARDPNHARRQMEIMEIKKKYGENNGGFSGER